ncbi:hypothetical protein PT974_00438 [Cladobotryum mycophilum]|uniref:Heterokaryon incompatibility domain-containing protein n=1 Tax=Cladobotryum mycophilum TaxID=491253 RepID=A0ABR0T0T4_9HYPO
MRAMYRSTLGGLTVDYSVSDSHVYTEAAWIILKASNNVEFLRYACQDSRDGSFPTWVPAWTAPTHIPEQLYKFSPATLSQTVISDVDDSTSRTLKFKGLRVDKATSSISKRFPTISVSLYGFSRALDLNLVGDAFAVFRVWVQAMGLESNQDPRLRKIASLISQTSSGKGRVLNVTDWLLKIRHENEFGIEGLLEFFRAGKDYDARKITCDFSRLVSGRWLFTTESGGIGMSTLEVHEGDEVALFTGERLPYLIRKSPEHAGKHTLVAPCWISDAIGGEPWPGWSGQVEDLEDIELV